MTMPIIAPGASVAAAGGGVGLHVIPDRSPSYTTQHIQLISFEAFCGSHSTLYH